MLTLEEAIELIRAMTPIIAITVTVWGGTAAYRVQKRFDRQTALFNEVRTACAEYVALTLRLNRLAKDLRTPEGRKAFMFSEDYEKVRESYQLIMMCSTDNEIRTSVERLSALDDVRFKAIWAAIDAGLMPFQEGTELFEKYKTADDTFKEHLPEFYTKIRERMSMHINGKTS